MKRLKAALIFGGEGREREVSLKSKRNLLPIFAEAGISPLPIHVDRRGIWREGSSRGGRLNITAGGGRGAFITRDGRRIIPDVAFPLLHGDFGEDGRIQGLLDSLHLPYVGCGVAAGALSSDKILTKRVAEALGIPTVPSVQITSAGEGEARLAEEVIGYPMFLKPAGLGSSIGCSLVTSPEELMPAMREAVFPSDRALAEEYLDGARELECAYFGSTRFGEIYTHPGEVRVRGVYTYAKKYGGGAETSVRADVPARISALIREYSEALVRAIGIRQIARIDYFLEGGRLYLNEINTMPGFTKSSLYAAMLNAAGISTCELISSLVSDAYDRRF